MNYQEFGLTILLQRKRNQITQAELAKLVGISRNYLSMIEQGEPVNLSVKILVNIAGAIKVDPCELLKILLQNQ